MTLSSHPKWPPAAIFVKNIQKKKVAYRSEMARNAIKSYLRTAKMAAGGHFVNNFKKLNKVPYGSEMARNAIESEFRTSKMAHQSEMARNELQSDFRHPNGRRKNKFCIDLKWPTSAILSKISKKF